MGLIFLSAMATSIAGICLEAGRDAATALGTSLLTMSVATFFTGACTLLVGAWVGWWGLVAMGAALQLLQL